MDAEVEGNSEAVELKGKLKVFCRCRPLNQVEISNGCISVVGFDSCLDNELYVCSDSPRKHFEFDHVFRPHDNQDAVFAQTKSIITSVLDGTTVCVIAFGQNGTGKTYTMEGISHKILDELIQICEQKQKTAISVGLFEINNGSITDLLEDNKSDPTRLEIKKEVDGTLQVLGLVEARLYDMDKVWELPRFPATCAHRLLRVTAVKGEKTSHLWLVDMGGTQPQRKTRARVLYTDDSVLTRILQSILDAGGVTLMFAHISPSSADFRETISLLEFSSQLRDLQKCIICLEVPHQAVQLVCNTGCPGNSCCHTLGRADCFRTLLFNNQYCGLEDEVVWYDNFEQLRFRNNNKSVSTDFMDCCHCKSPIRDVIRHPKREQFNEVPRLCDYRSHIGCKFRGDFLQMEQHIGSDQQRLLNIKAPFKEVPGVSALRELIHQREEPIDPKLPMHEIRDWVIEERARRQQQEMDIQWEVRNNY